MADICGPEKCARKFRPEQNLHPYRSWFRFSPSHPCLHSVLDCHPSLKTMPSSTATCREPAFKADRRRADQDLSSKVLQDVSFEEVIFLLVTCRTSMLSALQLFLSLCLQSSTMHLDILQAIFSPPSRGASGHLFSSRTRHPRHRERPAEKYCRTYPPPIKPGFQCSA